MTDKPNALKPEQLYRRCGEETFSFKTTDELEDLTEIIGQKRALDAVHFGTGIQQEGYNLFVMGPPGLGKHELVRNVLDAKISKEPTPSDYCYVNNFKYPHKPKMLCLPPGIGIKLSRDMDHLVEELRGSIPAAFESDEYRARVQDIEEEFSERKEKAYHELQKEAEEHHISLFRTPTGYAFAPIRNGEVISPEEFQKLSKEEQGKIETIVNNLQGKLETLIRQFSQLKRDSREKVKQLNREMIKFAVGHLIDELKKKYTDLPEILEYLDNVQEDVVEHVEDFRTQEEPRMLFPAAQQTQPSFHQYKVNVLVDHSESKGAPVVYEDLPTYQNLVGRIEHISQMGALVTDFTLIKAGALHQANGGYLILDARKILLQPFAYDGLKRALQAREIRIESIGQMLSLISTLSLEPEAIPLNVKVVLLGERLLYYLLCEFDPEFSELFKVAADFEERIDLTDENKQFYARLIATMVRKNKLTAFDRSAVARVIERSCRMVEDTEKMSTHLQGVADLLKEADYWARQQNDDVVSIPHVQKAIDTQIERASRLHERIVDEINRGTLLIDTTGRQVGQVNGLSVFELGGIAFGQPSRITATARLGEGEVIDIEREVELGGSIHSKGVLILSSFLGARYAEDHPLSLTASLVFEQSYGMIDGDSASTAELCTLLSALSGAPIKQSLAVTGSVNQHGQVQAIGAVNEKIEGFFDVCKKKELTGDQGVLIPASNVKHLMLRQEVVDAATNGQFHIYPVETVDQAIEILTGIPAGERDEKGNFPTGSINHRVQSRLEKLTDLRHEFLERHKDKLEHDQ